MSETDQATRRWSVSSTPTERRSVGRAPGFDRRAFLRRTALTGVAAGSVSTILAACGSSASSGGGSGRRRVRLAPELQIRVRQPRHDEPVLRAHAVRRRGRVQAAGLLLPVDGLGNQQRQPDGQRDEHRGDQRRRTGSRWR